MLALAVLAGFLGQITKADQVIRRSFNTNWEEVNELWYCMFGQAFNLPRAHLGCPTQLCDMCNACFVTLFLYKNENDKNMSEA